MCKSRTVWTRLGSRLTNMQATQGTWRKSVATWGKRCLFRQFRRMRRKKWIANMIRASDGCGRNHNHLRMHPNRKCWITNVEFFAKKANKRRCEWMNFMLIAHPDRSSVCSNLALKSNAIDWALDWFESNGLYRRIGSQPSRKSNESRYNSN